MLAGPDGKFSFTPTALMHFCRSSLLESNSSGCNYVHSLATFTSTGILSGQVRWLELRGNFCLHLLD